MRDLETEGAMYADVDIKNCDCERGSAWSANAGGHASDDAHWDVSVAGLLVGTAGAERCAVC